MKTQLWVTLALLAAVTLPASADIYRWVDAQGRVHYSDKPVEGAQRVKGVDSRPTDPAAVAERSQAAHDQREKALADAQKKQTDQAAAKHRGISAFIVDMAAPGISVQPILNIAGRRDFNQTFFDDVRVPAKDLVGGENNGWYVAATTLDFERSNIAAISGARRTVADLVAWAKERHAGRRPWDDANVRAHLAELHVEAEVGRLIAYRTAWLQAAGKVPNYEASIGKVWMAMLGIKVANYGVNLLGLYGQLTRGAEHAPIDGRVLESYLLAASGPVAGGTGEVQRNIIAQRGLGLPRG